MSKHTPTEYLAELDRREKQQERKIEARINQPPKPKVGKVSKKPVVFRAKRSVPLANSASCAYCGNPAQTFDHIIPMAHAALHTRRILDHESNQVPACYKCNQEKGDMPPNRWFELHPEYIERFMENGEHLAGRVKRATGLNFPAKG